MKHLKLLSTCIVISLAVVLTGCHTVYGVGQDLQEGGKTLSKSAEKHGG